MKRFACGCLLPLFGALLPTGASAQDCDPRFRNSPEIGEVLTLGQPRENRNWWEGLR